MQNPKVSIIMGVFNDEKFLATALESVLAQTFEDFELIICDDGSTDGSVEIAKAYEKKDMRIRFICNEKNMGLADTLNTCISYAKGDFIARMDSDDVMHKERLEKQYAFMLQNESIAVVGSNIVYIDNEGREYKSINVPAKVELSYAVKKFCVVHPSVMMRTSAIHAVGGYSVHVDTQRAEDYDLWCKLLTHDFKIANLQEPLLYYREDLSGLKKRRYRYRIQEYRLKKAWMKKTSQPCTAYLYAIKPLVVGLIPTGIMHQIKKK